MSVFGLLLIKYLSLAYAQNSNSNTVVTRVGNPTQPAPVNTGPGSLPAGTTASCPIPNGVIGCASYGPPKPWGGFYGSCAPDSTGNGGHCNRNYQSDVGICTNLYSGGNLIRTAKSIDVTARGGSRAGDPVYLPTIKGKPLKWYYQGSLSAGAGFGGMRLFQSERTPEGIYSIHFIHVNQTSPGFSVGQELNSGDVAAYLFSLDWPHAHITVGLNVGDSTSNLQDYSPNWLWADRDLGMCTN